MKDRAKKLLSLFLAFVLTASLCAVPTVAAGVTVSLAFENGKWNEPDADIYEDGRFYSVDVTISGESSISFTGGSICFSFDKSALEYYYAVKGDIPDVGSGAKKKEMGFTPADEVSANSIGGGTCAFADTSGTAHTVASGAVIATLYFIPAADAEKCSTKISFTPANDQLNGFKNGTDILTTLVGSDITLDVPGVTPTLNAVSLNAQENTVTVVGGNAEAQSVQASAASAKGSDLTASVAWSVFPSGQGVTINSATGAISVAAKATEGSYTVTATPDGTNVQGTAKTATLTVAHNASILTTVELDKASVTVDGTNTQTVTATAIDQYDDTISSGITWSDNSNDVTNNENVFTVAAKAAADTTVTVTANQSGTQKTAQFTVSRVQAAPATVTVTGGQTDILVPADGAPANTSTAFTAEVKDQFGDVMTGANVTWTVKDGNSAVPGVSVAGGVVTVTNNAKTPITDTTGKMLTVTASCGSASGTASITVKRDTAVAATATVSGGQSSILIPANGANVNVSTAFTAVVSDQYGSVFSSTVSWTVKDGDSVVTGVSIGGGVVTVTNDAKTAISDTTGKSLTVTASCGSVSGTANITVKRDTPALQSFEVSLSSNAVNAPKNDTPATVTASAINGKDQYGADFTPANVSYALSGAFSGVSISGSTVSVTKEASRLANTATAVTVNASCGSVNATGAMLTVNHEALTVESLEINGVGDADVIGVKSAKTYTATAKDQYGYTISDAAVSWALSENGDETNITLSGSTVSVSDNESVDGKTVKLTATCGGKSDSVVITARKVSIDWDTYFTAKTEITYGDNAKSAFSKTSSAGKATAYINGQETQIDGQFSINAPDLSAGESKTVTVSFTVTQGCIYKDTVLTKDYTVKVNPKAVTVAAGTYAIVKDYDGTTAAGTASGSLSVSGIPASDVGKVVVMTGILPVYSSANVGSYSGALPISLNGTGAGNYTLSGVSTVAIPMTINKVSVSIKSDAPTKTILANDTSNIGTSALKTSFNLPETVKVSGVGASETDAAITWADATQSFNAKGTTYTYVGTVSSGNFSNAPTLTATLTVSPVTATMSLANTAGTKVMAELDAAANYAAMGLPTSIIVVYDNSVEDTTYSVTGWNKSLVEIQAADASSGDITLTLTPTFEAPAWATLGTTPTFALTVKEKYPVTVSFSAAPTNVTYGTALSAPAATQTADGFGTDAVASYTYTYTGMTLGGQPYSSTTAPTAAGTYTVTAELVSSTHSGKATSGEFTIGQKEVGLSWNNADTRSYDGMASTVTATATGLISGDTCTVTVIGGTEKSAGTYTATATALSNINYKLPSSATKQYTINKASAPELSASATQTLLAADVVSGEKAYSFDLSGIITGVPADAGTVSYAVKSFGSYTGSCTVVGSALSFTVATAQSKDTPDSVAVTVSSRNYADADVTISFQFKSKTDVTDALSLANITKTYGENYSVSAKYNGASSANFSYAYTGTGSTTYSSSTAPTKAGTYSVTATYEDAVEENGIPGHIGTVTATITINPKSVTITGVTAANKTYDRSTAATAGGTAAVSGKVGSDDVTVVVGSAAFADRNVGTGKTVTFTGYSLSGADAANYTLSSQPASVTANITAKSVTITGLTATNKTYDGTTVATVSGTAAISGKIGDDTVTVSAGTAAFADKNVGTGKQVSFTGYSLSGTDAGNYTLSAQPANVTANITAAEIAAAAIADGTVAVTKTYDGTTDAATATGALTVTGVNGESLTLTVSAASAYGNAAVGTGKTVTLTLGSLQDNGDVKASNYALASGLTTYSFTKAAITAAEFSFSVNGNQSVKVGSGLSALQKPANGTGVSSETVSGTFYWYTNSARTAAAQDSDISGLAVDATKTLYWKFTATDGNYTATPKTGSVAVTIIAGDPQNISFANASMTKTYGDAAFTNTVSVKTTDDAEADGHGTVTYASSNTAVATVSTTGEVTILKAGQTTITASAAAVPGVYAAGSNSYVLTVNPKSVTPELSTIDAQTYIGTQLTPAVTPSFGAGNSLTLGTDYTISYGENVNAGTDAGSVTVSPVSTSNYTFTAATKTFNINKAERNLQITAPTADITLIPGKLSYQSEVTYANVDDSAAVTYTSSDTSAVCVETDGLISALADGSAVITVSIAETENYKAAEPKTFNVTAWVAVPVTGVAAGANRTAVIDGERIIVSGTKSDAGESIAVTLSFADGSGFVQAAGASANETTVKFGETVVARYAIDTANVTVLPDNTVIEEPETKVDEETKINTENYSGDAKTAAAEVLSNASKADTGVEGLKETASKQMIEAAEAAEAALTPEQKTALGENYTLEIALSVSVTPTAIVYEGGELKSITMDITPAYSIVAKAQGGTPEIPVGEMQVITQLPGKVKINVCIPVGFEPNYVKHTHNGVVEYLPVEIDKTTQSSGYWVASWWQNSFSTVELISDNRAADVSFTMEDGSVSKFNFTPENVGAAFPTESKAGYTFDGWIFNAGGTALSGFTEPQKTLTDELLTALDGQSNITATAKFTYIPTGGGGYVAPEKKTINLPVEVKNGTIFTDHATAASGDTVTLTVTPDKGFTLETLTVTDARGNKITLTNNEDGTYTFKMPASAVSVSISFMEDNTMLNFFVDVTVQDYYYDAVLWAAKNGITNGMDETHFGPELSCTRAQNVTFLWRAAGCPEPVGTDCPFTDVEADAYYYKAVLWAVEQGITKGTSKTEFSPDLIVSRAQTVTFLFRMAKAAAADSENPFVDVASTEYYYDAVLWAADKGVTLGMDETHFGPGADCTRGQIVTFFYRYFQ